MHTLRSAAALLLRADDSAGLAALVAQLGFESPTPLGEAARSLGIDELVSDAAVARGPGALRALVCTVSDAGGARAVVPRLAARLGAGSPELLWLVCVAERGESGGSVVAAWSGERRPPRVSALVVDRARIVDSDAETICALASASDGDDLLTHARWLDVLGREALTGRFYRALERLVRVLADSASGSAPAEVRRELALLTVSRLLFLGFLEAKGWLDGDRGFLQRGFDRCVAGGGRYHARVLRPLFFGTLNTPVWKRAPEARRFGRVPFLNGGLFACGRVERRWRGLELPDEAMGRLFGELLGRYRFTAREDAADWTEAAVDPEMLGRAFEGLMAPAERRSSGAFYTPQPMVERVTAAALTRALAGGPVSEAAVRDALAGRRPASGADSLGSRAAELRVLDPACGSGAFLVHVLERLATVRAACGDDRPTDAIRRAVLTRSVFGVDVNPTAVWLCELRLWLSAVIDSDEADPLRVVPLPNLDRNVRVGDSLAGPAFGDGVGAAVGRRVAELRDRYSRAVGARKRTLARTLERTERGAALASVDRELAAAVAVRAEQVRALRAPDLFGRRATPSAGERAALAAARECVRRVRAVRRSLELGSALPFSYAAHFADVGARGGFDAVVGNPPWLPVGRLAPDARARVRGEYRVCRGAAWSVGGEAARASAAFAGQVDVSALFIERSLRLLRPGGVTALLVPAKLWRSLAGGSVRRLLVERAALCAIEDDGDGPSGFDAVVYPSVVVARAVAGVPAEGLFASSDAGPVGGPCARVVVRRGEACMSWRQRVSGLGADGTSGAPWLLVPPAVRAGFDRVRAAGVAWGVGRRCGVPGRVWLGVKSGCNEAFVGRRVASAEVGGGRVAMEDAAGRRVLVESAYVRPLVRGEGVRRWHVRGTDELLLWPIGTDGQALAKLPDGVRRWLSPYRGQLERRADARRGAWWSLFRLDGSMGGAGGRVVWSDIGRRPRAAVLAAGDPSVVLNSCYVVWCDDDESAWALAALMNAPLIGAWLNVLAEPARGGYRRYLAWTVAMLPVPPRWEQCRAGLAAAGRRAAAGDEAMLHEAVLEAYGLSPEDVAELLAWGLA